MKCYIFVLREVAVIDFYAENGSVKYKHKRFFPSHYANGRKDDRNKHNVFLRYAGTRRQHVWRGAFILSKRKQKKFVFLQRKKIQYQYFIVVRHRNLMRCNQSPLIRFFLMENPAEDAYIMLRFLCGEKLKTVSSLLMLRLVKNWDVLKI